MSKRGEVARLGDDRAGGGAKADPHLAREDSGKRGLAEPGRAVKQDMVERLAPALRGMDEHAQILARALLPDELVESLRPKRQIGVFGSPFRRGDSGGISRHPTPECSRMFAVDARARTTRARWCSHQRKARLRGLREPLGDDAHLDGCRTVLSIRVLDLLAENLDPVVLALLPHGERGVCEIGVVECA